MSYGAPCPSAAQETQVRPLVRTDRTSTPAHAECRVQDDAPVNVELGLRVQALEALIRTNANMDANMASAAAMETVLQATKAAHLGNSDAENALAQLSGVDGLANMGDEQRRGILMDVLQQVRPQKQTVSSSDVN